MRLFLVIVAESLILGLFWIFRTTEFFFYGLGIEFIKLGEPLLLLLFFFLVGYINAFFVKGKTFFESGAVSIGLMFVIVIFSFVFISVYDAILIGSLSALSNVLSLDFVFSTIFISLLTILVLNYLFPIIGLLLGVFVNLHFY